MKIQAAVLLFLVISIIHCTCLSEVISGRCLDHQWSLLLQLKNDFTFDPFTATKLSSWNESGQAMYGALENSSSLFSLRHLQFLNLEAKLFNSSIPSGFNKLNNLNHLNWADAGFVGQVPTKNFQLTRLVTLVLSISNYLKLDNLNLGKLVQNLTNIINMYLDYVSISGEGHEWHNSLLLMPYLQELSLTACGLMGTFLP
ncbi:hypothetical protein PIB30_052732 [Stylosanthes scabra]|uniref:Uncharacterized protein n=1 Tax=Stylosanthes scabra TaxID=79078 RepID=A0ABU6THZ5_9FABA|nr:hypothetical protein [Stylosanthes scabra]